MVLSALQNTRRKTVKSIALLSAAAALIVGHAASAGWENLATPKIATLSESTFMNLPPAQKALVIYAVMEAHAVFEKRASAAYGQNELAIDTQWPSLFALLLSSQQAQANAAAAAPGGAAAAAPMYNSKTHCIYAVHMIPLKNGRCLDTPEMRDKEICKERSAPLLCDSTLTGTNNGKPFCAKLGQGASVQCIDSFLKALNSEMAKAKDAGAALSGRSFEDLVKEYNIVGPKTPDVQEKLDRELQLVFMLMTERMGIDPVKIGARITQVRLYCKEPAKHNNEECKRLVAYFNLMETVQKTAYAGGSKSVCGTSGFVIEGAPFDLDAALKDHRKQRGQFPADYQNIKLITETSALKERRLKASVDSGNDVIKIANASSATFDASGSMVLNIERHAGDKLIETWSGNLTVKSDGNGNPTCEWSADEKSRNRFPIDSAKVCGDNRGESSKGGNHNEDIAKASGVSAALSGDSNPSFQNRVREFCSGYTPTATCLADANSTRIGIGINEGKRKGLLRRKSKSLNLKLDNNGVDRFLGSEGLKEINLNDSRAVEGYFADPNNRRSLSNFVLRRKDTYDWASRGVVTLKDANDAKGASERLNNLDAQRARNYLRLDNNSGAAREFAKEADKCKQDGNRLIAIGEGKGAARGVGVRDGMENPNPARGSASTVVCAQTNSNGDIKRVTKSFVTYNNWPGLAAQANAQPLFFEMGDFTDRLNEKFPGEINMYRFRDGIPEDKPFFAQKDPKRVGDYMVYDSTYNKCVYEKDSFEDPMDNRPNPIKVYEVMNSRGVVEKLVACNTETRSVDQDFTLAGAKKPYVIAEYKREGKSQGPITLASENNTCKFRSGNHEFTFRGRGFEEKRAPEVKKTLGVQ